MSNLWQGNADACELPNTRNVMVFTLPNVLSRSWLSSGVAFGASAAKALLTH